MRRGQVSVLVLGLSVPLLALAFPALALLGAHVQGLRAQLPAGAAALRAALAGRPGTATVALPVTALRLPVLGRVAYTARGRASARAVRTDEGRRGAVLVG
jgi:hypothetical protein